MGNKQEVPWMVLDSRLNDLEYLEKTLQVLLDYALDKDEAIGTIFMAPFGELKHISEDLRAAFDAWHEQRSRTEASTE